MFITRLISSVVLVVAALLTILMGGYVLAAVLLFLSLVAYRELMKACKLDNGLQSVGYVGIVVYYLLMVFVEERSYLFLAVVLILMSFLALYVLTFPRYHAEQIMSSFFNVAYAPIELSFIYLVRGLPYGQYSVWMIFISSWICDTCAYLTGMLIGKHKLSPKLSPKKSIEGAVGGVAGSALVGALYGYFVVEPVIQEPVTIAFAIISAIGAVISQIGDLAASAIKRNHDIKDYGRLIPGHGGVMDRFDSVIFTAPMVYLLVLVMLHGGGV